MSERLQLALRPLSKAYRLEGARSEGVQVDRSDPRGINTLSRDHKYVSGASPVEPLSDGPMTIFCDPKNWVTKNRHRKFQRGCGERARRAIQEGAPARPYVRLPADGVVTPNSPTSTGVDPGRLSKATVSIASKQRSAPRRNPGPFLVRVSLRNEANKNIKNIINQTSCVRRSLPCKPIQQMSQKA